MPDRSPLKLSPEFRALALEVADLLAKFRARLPRGEAGRKVCWVAEDRLRKLYGSKDDEKRISLLEFIGDHYRSIGDVERQLHYPRIKAEKLLESLVAAGVVTETRQPPIGGIGRKVRVFRIRKGLDLFTAKSEVKKKFAKN
jgi:hypothetical protein